MASPSIFELLQKKKQDLDAQSGRRAKTEKLPSGKSRWRILPGWRGASDPTMWHDFGQHFVKAPGSDKPAAVYVCTEATFGRPCEVCQEIEKGIMLTKDDSILSALKESKASRRVLVNAMRRDGAEPNKVVLLELPPSVFGQFIDVVNTFEKDGANVLDLNEGFDLWIERTGTGMNTKYNVTPSAKASKVEPSVMSQLNNLDDYVKQEYEAGLKKALAAVAAARGVATAAIGGPGMAASAGALTDETEDVSYVPSSSAVAAASTPAAVPAAPAPTPAPAAARPAAPAAAPAPAPAVNETSTEDLDALLGELGLGEAA